MNVPYGARYGERRTPAAWKMQIAAAAARTLLLNSMHPETGTVPKYPSQGDRRAEPEHHEGYWEHHRVPPDDPAEAAVRPQAGGHQRHHGAQLDQIRRGYQTGALHPLEPGDLAQRSEQGYAQSQDHRCEDHRRARHHVRHALELQLQPSHDIRTVLELPPDGGCEPPGLLPVGHRAAANVAKHAGDLLRYRRQRLFDSTLNIPSADVHLPSEG